MRCWFRILKRNGNDEDVLQRARIWLTKRHGRMISSRLKIEKRRGRGMISEGSRSCREMPDTRSLRRVLERRSGDAATSPDVCDADAG